MLMPCRVRLSLVAAALMVVVPAVSPALARDASTAAGKHEITTATWYGERFRGQLTANGEVFDPEGMTAAHATLPLGTMVMVSQPDNGRSVVVRINDRNAGQPGIDLAKGAARKLDMVEDGRVPVVVTPLPQVAQR